MYIHKYITHTHTYTHTHTMQAHIYVYTHTHCKLTAFVAPCPEVQLPVQPSRDETGPALSHDDRLEEHGEGLIDIDI